MMSRRDVLVPHLNAIENLGSMEVLRTDKTGTLTRGVVEVGADERELTLAGFVTFLDEPKPGVEQALRAATA